jgi:hypothetical protein
MSTTMSGCRVLNRHCHRIVRPSFISPIELNSLWALLECGHSSKLLESKFLARHEGEYEWCKRSLQRLEASTATRIMGSRKSEPNFENVLDERPDGAREFKFLDMNDILFTHTIGIFGRRGSGKVFIRLMYYYSLIDVANGLCLCFV